VITECLTRANRPGYSGSLQIPARLSPSIFVDDIGERNTTDWTEPAHWVAHRQQRIGMNIRRQTEFGFRLLLELQVQRRLSRAEAERSCCQ